MEGWTQTNQVQSKQGIGAGLRRWGWLFTGEAVTFDENGRVEDGVLSIGNGNCHAIGLAAP